MKKIAFLIILMLSFIFVSANAQNEISPEKSQAIKELISLIKKENNAEDLAKVMLAQSDSMSEEVIISILNERKDLTPADRASLRKTLSASHKEYAKKFQDKFLEKVNFSEMVDEISLIVYDKFYTLEEINDLVAFYKTPTGQKTLKTMQPLMIETIKLTQERVIPKAISVMNELMNEQRVELAKKLNELKPPKKANK